MVELPAPPPAETGAAAPIRWDQRFLTVLAATLDVPEDTPALASVLHDWASKAASFGARIEEITPSGLLAVFGIEPIEDGPRRAVQAACAMLESPQVASEPNLISLGRCAIHVGRYRIASTGPATGMDTRARHNARMVVDALLDQAGPRGVVLDQLLPGSWNRTSNLRRLGTPMLAVTF